MLEGKGERVMSSRFDTAMIQQLIYEIKLTYAIDIVQYEILKSVEGFNKVLLIHDLHYEPYIVKLHFDQYVTPKTLHAQQLFKTKVRDTGLAVPRHILTLEHASYSKFNNRYYHIETYIGNQEESAEVNHFSLGHWLAKLHNVSSECHLSLETGTQWQIFGDNITNTLSDYNRMKEIYYFVFKMYPEIKPLIQQHMLRLRAIWDQLPQGVTHGDYGQYNIVFSEEGTVSGLYDFDLIGHDTYVNELAHSVLLNCFYIKGHDFISQDGFSAYYQFIKGYLSARKLSILEKEVFLLLMKLDFIGYYFKQMPVSIITDLLEGEYDAKITLNLYDDSE